MLLIDNEIVRRVLTMKDCLEAQLAAFAAAARGEAVGRPRIDTFSPCGIPGGYYRFGSLEGASDGVHAVRLKSDVMTWPEHGDGTQSEQKFCMQPGTYCGLLLLFSTRNGEPLAIINDGHLQHMRVGAAAGVGTKLLSRPDSRRLGVIGSGGMARTALEAIALVRDLEEVRVYSRNAGNRDRFAAGMGKQLNLNIVPVDRAQDAVAGMDILATCTDSMKPVIEGAWLEPGQHVVNIGPLDLGPDARARIDCVVLQGVASLPIPESDEFQRGLGHSHGAFVAGTPEQRATLPRTHKTRDGEGRGALYADVIAGRAPGRTSPTQITQYRPVGNWGLQFSSTGAVVYREAKKAGLGRELPTEWFLQDVKN